MKRNLASLAFLVVLNTFLFPPIPVQASQNSINFTITEVTSYEFPATNSLPRGIKKKNVKFNNFVNNCKRLGFKDGFAWYASSRTSPLTKLKATTKVTDYYWTVDEYGEDVLRFDFTCKKTGKIKFGNSNAFMFCAIGPKVRMLCSDDYTKSYLSKKKWKVSITNYIYLDGYQEYFVSPNADPALVVPEQPPPPDYSEQLPDYSMSEEIPGEPAPEEF